MFAVLPVEKYYERLSALLDIKQGERFYFDSPDAIFRRMGKKNYTITWIEDWERYEWGMLPLEEEWDENNFYNLVFKDLSNQKVLLLMHYGVYRKECFEFDLDSFYEFVEWYEDRYQMSFMQPHDYILIFENNLIKALHHGGIIMEQHTPMLDKEISDGIGKIMGLLLAKGSS